MKKNNCNEISFYAAECIEFVDYGECIEVSDIAKAVACYKKLCKRGSASGPGIGFILHDRSIPDYSEVHWPLYQCGRIAEDDINLISAYREHPLVLQAVQELKQSLPELSKAVKTKRGMER